MVFCTTVEPDTTEEGKIYSDLCGRSPKTSSRGNKYIYVMYVYDCNAILATEMKSTINREMIRAFTELTKDLKIRGINTGFHFMDNEVPAALKMTMTTMNNKYKLSPPSNHRANNVERSIQTFKNSFIAGLCSLDKEFHLQLRDRLLHQATISLNLLRQPIIHPHLSAYTPIFVELGYNRAPFAPTGTKIVIKIRTNNR